MKTSSFLSETYFLQNTVALFRVTVYFFLIDFISILPKKIEKHNVMKRNVMQYMTSRIEEQNVMKKNYAHSL